MLATCWGDESSKPIAEFFQLSSTIYTQLRFSYTSAPQRYDRIKTIFTLMSFKVLGTAYKQSLKCGRYSFFLQPYLYIFNANVFFFSVTGMYIHQTV